VRCVTLYADDDNDAVLFEKIKSGNYDADDPIWENISIEAKDVVAKLLTVRGSSSDNNNATNNH
jgi:calcium/calmodulin-dependent protein kinase I